MKYLGKLLGILVSGLVWMGGAQAQSFSVAVTGKSDGDVAVAGHYYPLTVTSSEGGVYAGTHSIAMSTTSSGGALPQVCSTPTPGNCTTVNACLDADATTRNIGFDAAGVANLCLVMPDVGTFSLGVADGGISGAGPSLRTVPSYFELVLPSPPAPSVINRSELSSCPSTPNYTYIGEPLTVKFSLIARNESDAKTNNYPGNAFNAAISDTDHWARDDTNGTMGLRFVGTGYPPGSGVDSRISISSATANWSGGKGDFQATVMLSRAANGKGPYNGIAVGIRPRDDDGVTLRETDYNLDADSDGSNERKSVGVTTLYHGRLKIANAYGSDLLPLPVDVQAQVWNGSGFVNFEGDSCTPLIDGYFTLGQVGTLLQPATSVAGSGRLDNKGKGRIALNKPSTAVTGKAITAIKTKPDNAVPPPPGLPGLDSYLPGLGTGTFGVYHSGPVLYRRELHY